MVSIITFVMASITASFVVKEKTLEKACADLVEGESINRSSTKKIQMKELTHDDERLNLLKRGS